MKVRKKILIVFILACALSGPASGAERPPDKAQAFVELGLKFYEKMDYEKAGVYFSEAQKLRPGGKYKRFIGYALQVLEVYSSELKMIEDMNKTLLSARKPDRSLLTKRLSSEHLELGRRLLEKDGYVAIIKSHFDYVISHDPLNLEARLLLGDISYRGMLYKEAIDQYKKALEIYPDNPFFSQRLGDIYAGLGVYDEAKVYYEKASGLFKRSRLEDKAEKIEYLRKLMGKLPTSLEEIKGLIDEKRYADTIALCKKRTGMNPSDVTAITYMGIAFEESGDWKRAQALYKTAIKRNPEYPAPYYYLGRIYLLKRKDPKRAIAEITKFEEKAEDLLGIDKNARQGIIDAHRTLVYIYHEILRDYGKAVTESRRLLRLAPDDQEARYNLALSYAYLDKKSMAYAEFKKAIGLGPDTKIARYAKDAIEAMRKYPNMKTFPYRPIEE